MKIISRFEEAVLNYQKEVKEIHCFYNTSQENSTNQKGLIEMVQNQRFLLYARLSNLLWMPAYYGSALLSFFDGGKYNREKLAAMVCTFPALLAGYVFYGAFWSKLGDEKLLLDSFRKNPRRTFGKIFVNNIKGNFYQYYYYLKLAEEFLKKTDRQFDELSFKFLETANNINPKISRTLESLAFSFPRF